MSVLKAKIGGVLSAVVAAAAVVALPGAASAQGLIEFLWGGEQVQITIEGIGTITNTIVKG